MTFSTNNILAGFDNETEYKFLFRPKSVHLSAISLLLQVEITSTLRILFIFLLLTPP
jgi:hypothetical protein